MRLFGILLATPVAFAAPFLAAQGDVIPEKWIVVMKDGSMPDPASRRKRAAAVESLAMPRHSYNMGTFQGYAVDASSEIINKIAELEEVSLSPGPSRRD